ncbi:MULTISPECIES: hypothetical protein [Enterobacteriaceae]|uniref:hypothetical protein n=1 Tax=Enterobacteriaceae TaxID=543 RepID=UPI0013D2BB8F|nr:MULTISPECIES: hypothetical protein [Enterobacteriaceae]MBX4797471.1 hypothetical protein [Klebsiella michiganensis]MDH7967515.1 hypothetical protein [Escherichia coli]QXB76945.1 hypothetical protein I6L62_19755 [Enterobacter asburiae]
MNKKDLINSIDISELRKISSVIASYDVLDNIKNPDDMASYLYEGGNDLLFASNNENNGTNTRPTKAIWIKVRNELNLLLCTDDEKYSDLWERINRIEKISTQYVITTISLFLCDKFNFDKLIAGAIGQFVAIVFFFALRVGKESYCSTYIK